MKKKTTSSSMKTSEKIIRAKEIFIKDGRGMCYCFKDVGYPILFNYYIAVLFFGARIGYKHGYWWSPYKREIRLRYFDWMIKTYKFFGK